MERQRFRQKGQDTGLLIMVVYIMINTKNNTYRQYIEREFFYKTTLRDVTHHFNNSGSHYNVVIDLVNAPADRQAIDKVLNNRGQWFRDVQFQ